MSYLDQPITLFQGETKVVTVTVYDGNGAPLSSLAGAVITWAYAVGPQGPALVTKTTSDGSITTSGGTYSFTLQPTDTNSRVGVFYHEGKIVDSGGNVSISQTGTLTITAALLA